MATLKPMDCNGRSLVLMTSETIGRAPSCTIAIPDPQVSSVHACVEWHGSGWIARDLGSRNGTYIDDRELKAGEDTPVARGAVLRVARAYTWRLVDDSPPVAMALLTPQRDADDAYQGRDAVCAEGGLLSLPRGVDEPSMTIFRTAIGTWLAETADDQRQIHDGEVLKVRKKQYRIHLPGRINTTQAPGAGATLVSALGWRFDVSRDEEHVTLTVRSQASSWDIPPRAFLYTLLTLARIRLRDQTQTDLPVSSHGWIDQDELVGMLDYTTSHLHTDIYRARRCLGSCGIVDAATVVERRPRARQLRFGHGNIAIRTL